MGDHVTVGDLRSMTLAELEAQWARPGEPPVPTGVYRGRVLRWLGHPTARRPLWRWTERLGFEWLPFGVDFDRRLWFFVSRHLAAGRFEPRAGRSRWRDTDSVALLYHPSRLPAPVRGILYDEVKPLSDSLTLGIGGIDAGPGEGDHFFFSLERMR